ncbi:hypothetical protein [Jannaschia sp. W003]|uniref:hypothetical protein n=1 Tax=Jannaschia sp. W003 TaxID=2867012 RepID=UPI0021A27FBF|nr:hypothetical protein [Jannaschia sp. W003]UWQ20693.1 hypothetical protein K3554_11965 [Jannaschia sp. W003]
MYFLVADEAVHQQTDPTKFFIYGGIIVPVDKVSSLTLGIEHIRSKYGFLPGDSLKFSPNDRPKQVSRERFLEAKQMVLSLVAKEAVQFIGYAVLHALARTRTSEELVTWGADALLIKFQQFLEEQGDSRGLAFFDTLPIARPNRYLKNSFQMRLEHAKRGHRLANIDMIASTTDGCSHLTSICDICVGSFRYAVNEPQNDVVGKTLMRALKRIIWARRVPGSMYPLDRGILLRPKDIYSPAIRTDYQELQTRLFDWMNSKPSR